MAPAPAYALHAMATGVAGAPAEMVFAHLDDHLRLSAHMTKRSWMTVGSRMSIQTDAAGGRAVGSKISLRGRILGILIRLEEVVIEREPPRRKVWETIGEPRLLVIGSYRMGFELAPQAERCGVTVFIDYDFPESGLSRLLGRLLGGMYARWCTRRMVEDARRAFP